MDSESYLKMPCDKWILIDGEKVANGRWEYEVGEIITLNSVEKIKCVKKEVVEGELHHHFIRPRLTWDE